MHGLIFAELKKFVVDRYGAAAWNQLATEAGAAGKIFLPNQAYPDAELLPLLGTAAKLTGRSQDEILEDFGEFIAPDLLKLYGLQLNPQWKTLDLVENTESIIHRLVRARDPAASPPKIVCRREATDRAVMVYRSQRKLCSVAKGIVKGVAKTYGEEVRLSESTCMNHGGTQCEIQIQVQR
ncbi:MAG: heme NO-binding domain-containing protein [Methanobacteriota archaeon]